MAPKQPFKVHSLSKHVEDTQKGISAEAQYNRRTGTGPAIKKDVAGNNAHIFGNDDADSDSDRDSDDSSDGEDQTDFLRKLTNTSSAPPAKTAALKKEIANSDAERKPLAATKQSASKAAKEESTSESESGSDSEAESSSEDEDEDETADSKPKTNGAAPATATTTTSPTSSSGEEESSDEDSNKNGVKLQAPATAEQSSSEESGSSSEESSSESEEESEEEATKKPVINGKAPAATNTSKKVSSGSESNEAVAKQSAANSKEKSEKPTAAEKSDHQSDSESESEASSDDEDNAMVDESMHISDREEAGQLTGPNFIAPDFMIRRGDKDVNGKDVAEVCNQANLQGKQFWYFTVPSDIPISVVQNMEIPIDTAQRGDSVFSHNGDSYGVSFDNMTPKSTIQILIPSADGTKYQAAPRVVDQVVQVKRIATLGGSSTGTADPAYKRPVRPQPKGLKARYQPIGVSGSMGVIGDESEGDEADTEMADAPSLSVPSSSTELVKEKKKRKSKAKSTDEAESIPETPKKSKKLKGKAEEAGHVRQGKRKLTSSDEDAVAASSQLLEENQNAESKPKKQKTVRKASPDLGAKVTPVTVPTPGFSFQNLPAEGDTSTPKAAKKVSKKKADTAAGAEKSTPSTATKKAAAAKESKSKIEIPIPSSSQASAPASRNTPIAPPVIYGQPVPSSSAAAAPSSTPTPSSKPKKASSSKKKDAP